MQVWMGGSGLDESKQAPFPEQTPCVHCKGPANVAFVAAENNEDGGDAPPWVNVCDSRPAADGKRWPHDLTAFAIYLCGDCLKATALFNQA